MKAVLLDRDGVINSLVYHQDAGIVDAPFTVSRFKLLPRVPEAIRQLNELGLKTAIVSNQPGVAKGHLARDVFEKFETMMLDGIRTAGGKIDKIYYCMHHPEAQIPELRMVCRCRKPEIGMLQQASLDMGVALDECYMIGDGIPDLQAGTRAGCRTIFVGRWKCEICEFMGDERVRPDLIAKDLWEASQLIRMEVTGQRAL
jgi:D-glycero-D-manno-heptose 1,7-bisphosphate phosphatase